MPHVGFVCICPTCKLERPECRFETYENQFVGTSSNATSSSSDSSLPALPRVSIDSEQLTKVPNRGTVQMSDHRPVSSLADSSSSHMTSG
jgi:hypothetical protein